MLVKKNVLNEIKKEGTFSRTAAKSKGKYLKIYISKFKVSSEKALLALLYEFPFSLNPGDKPTDAQT